MQWVPSKHHAGHPLVRALVELTGMERSEARETLAAAKHGDSEACEKIAAALETLDEESCQKPPVKLLHLLANRDLERFRGEACAMRHERKAEKKEQCIAKKAQKLAEFTGQDVETSKAQILAAWSGDADAKRELHEVKQKAKAMWREKKESHDDDDMEDFSRCGKGGGKGRAWMHGFFFGKGFAKGHGKGSAPGHHHGPHHRGGPLVRKLVQLSGIEWEDAHKIIHGAKHGDEEMREKLAEVISSSD